MRAKLDNNIEKITACVPDRDQSSSIVCISNSFLFNIDIVHHFNTVNHSNATEAGHMQTLDTCIHTAIGHTHSLDSRHTLYSAVCKV